MSAADIIAIVDHVFGLAVLGAVVYWAFFK